jgi:ABC-type multidrug transport system fused ATPase/permease subunit
LKRIESNAKSPLLSLFGETLNGVATIRAFGVQKRFMQASTDRIDAANRPFYMFWATNRWLSWRTEVCGAFVSFFAAWFVVANVGRIDAGLAGFSLVYSMRFTEMLLVRNGWFG